MNKRDYLLIALEQARLGQGFCAPNPAVGAVLELAGQLLAYGHHHGPGKPHAEVEALTALATQQDLAAATLFVTLEPCCHHGRTPPCTTLIIERGVGRVVFAQLDPNPEVAGQGMQRLNAAGIDCEHYPVAAISEFYQAYRYWWQTGNAWMTLKLALSSDAKVAGPKRQPASITGEACRHFTHQQRLCSDILVTTAETILQDDPQMNVRLANNTLSKPLAILDRRLRLPLTARIVTTAHSIIVFYSDAYADAQKLSQLQAVGIQCVAIASVPQGLDLLSVKHYLGNFGYHRAWVEVGARCFQSLIQQHCINDCYLYFADKRLGDDAYGFAGYRYWQSAVTVQWFDHNIVYLQAIITDMLAAR